MIVGAPFALQAVTIIMWVNAVVLLWEELSGKEYITWWGVAFWFFVALILLGMVLSRE